MRTGHILCFLILFSISNGMFAQQRQLFLLGDLYINPSFDLELDSGKLVISGLNTINSINYNDQTNPVVSGFCGLPHFVTSLFADGDKLYASGGMNGGFYIVDLSFYPTINLIGSTTIQGTTYQMDKKSNFLYLTTNNDSLYVIDVLSPTNPVVLSSSFVSGFTPGVAIINDRLYLGGSTGLHIYDISNPASPVFLNTMPGSFGNLLADPQNELLYIYSNMGVSMYDVTGMQQPVPGPQYISSNSGSVIDPLAIIDQDLFRVAGGSVEVFETGIGNSFPVSSYNLGAQVTAVEVQDSTVFVSGVNGLYILRYGYTDPLGVNDGLNFDDSQIWPIPTGDFLNLPASSLGKKVEIYDINGALVIENFCITETIDISNLPSGTYTLCFSSDSTKKFSAFKFVKK